MIPNFLSIFEKLQYVIPGNFTLKTLDKFIINLEHSSFNDLALKLHPASDLWYSTQQVNGILIEKNPQLITDTSNVCTCKVRF